MEKYLEMTGKTTEDAVAAALKELGLERDDVSVEILEMPVRRLLGRSTPARVRVSYEAPDQAPAQPAPKAEAARPEVKKETKAPAGKPAAPAEAKPAAPAEAKPADASDDRAEQIDRFLTGLFEQMGVDAAPQITRNEEGDYQVILVGSELSAVIGRRGETLDAIQQLTGYVINRGRSKRVRVRMDAEDYRAKREESLQRLAHKVADKVLRTKSNVTLEPMNAYERHVIHAALQDYHKDIITYSMGTEPNRRTVVAYSKGAYRY